VAFPRLPGLIDKDMFQDLLIGGSINALFLLPGMILPILILPCMLLLYGGVVLPTLIYSGYMITFRSLFDYEVSKFVWNTNWNEAYEFLAARLPFFAWGALLFVVFFPFVLMVWVLRAPKPANTAKRMFCLLPLVLGVVFYEGYFMRLHPQEKTRTWLDNNVRVYFFRYYAREFYKYKNMDDYEKSLLRLMTQQPKEHFPLTGLKRTSDREFDGEIVGLVLVGESATRIHHGIYGYFRDTTPRLQAISSDLLIFDKAEAVASATTRALLGAFSFLDNQRGYLIDYTCSIFDILNEANFKTFWLTNSVIESIIAFSGADAFVRLINSNVQRYEDVNIADEKGKYLDGATLPLFRDILASSRSNKGIFVHFNGSHMHYVNRYPSEFSRFRDYPDDPRRPWLSPAKKNLIDQYDNSILYTDYIIAEFIEAIKDRGGASFVLYFSDHGEEVYDTQDFFGRVDKRVEKTPSIMKIPLILWLSDEYKTRFPEIAETARTNQHKDFVLDDLFWTMIDLYDLTFDGFRPDKSIVNKAYVPANVNSH
jgi:heptose-I-phosphate ethanolaminephosphotransferase